MYTSVYSKFWSFIALIVGIEGFKRRSSAKLKGDKLFVVYIGNGENKRTILGVIDENKMTLLDALMMGNTLDIADLNCEL